MSDKLILVKEGKVTAEGFFTKHINAYLEKNDDNFWQRKQVIRPSELGYCIRAQVMDILGLLPPETISARLRRIFDNGNSVHKRYLKSYIPRMNIACDVTLFERGQWVTKEFIEVTIHDPELWLKGAPDAVIFNPDDLLPYIFELKSIKHEDFVMLSNALEEHIAQAHSYMHMTKIPRAVVVYEDKDTQELKEFVIAFDSQLMDQLINKAKLIQKYVIEYPVNHQLPEKCNGHWCRACK